MDISCYNEGAEKFDIPDEANMEDGTLARAIHPFNTNIEGELSLNVGDMVQIHNTVDRYWYYGTNGYQAGNFPANFVVEVTLPDVDEKQEMFVAWEPFAAIEESDLGFNKGNIIIGLNAVDSNWWRGKLGNKIGIFPLTHAWKINKSLVKKRRASIVQLNARVIMDLTAQLDEEIDLVKDDIISVTEIIDKDWMRGECKGKSGIFPSSFVVLIEDSDTITAPVVNDLSVTSPYGKSLFDFVAQYPDELNFHAGEIILLHRHVDDQWLEGELNGKLGFFPKTHIEIIVDCAPQSSSQESSFNVVQSVCDYNSAQDSTITSSQARALFDYTAQSPEDISLVENELIEICRKVNDEWYEAKDSQGKTGLCPANYLSLVTAKKTESASVIQPPSFDLNRKLTTVANPSAVIVSETFLRRDFNKPRAVSDSTALEKSIAKNLANLDFNILDQKQRRSESFGTYSATYFPPPARPTSFSHSSKVSSSDFPLQRTRPKSHTVIIPPPRPKPPVFTTKTQVPQRPPPPITVKETSEPKIPLVLPQPLIPEPEISPPPPLMIPEDVTDNLPSLKVSEPVFIALPPVTSEPTPEVLPPPLVPEIVQHPPTRTPLRAAPPPPVNKDNNSDAQNSFSRGHSVNGYHRVPIRPAPAPPTKMTNEGCESLNGIQRKISERENNLKQLQCAKNELDSHLISRQSSQEVMHDQVKAYEDTINGLSSEIYSLRETAYKMVDNADDNEETKLRLQEIRQKNAEKRRRVIMELMETEEDYVKELKLCLDVFFQSVTEATNIGMNLAFLFGNIDQIIKIGEKLLQSLKDSSAERNLEDIVVGQCFQDIAPQMKEVYSIYCSNHDEVIQHLTKYQDNENIQTFIASKITQIRQKTACFSLGSVLIKPVQRILKYPLLLNELIKATDDDHPDMPQLQQAIHLMTDTATAINEFKRRRELVTKYRKDSDTSFTSMMSRISIHSVVKKSTRIGMRLSSSIGLTNVTKDDAFDDEEMKFRSIDKTIRSFIKDTTEFCILLEEWVNGSFYSAEHFASVYADQCRLPAVDNYRTVQRELYTVIWKEFKDYTGDYIIHPLTDLLNLFQGPIKLIDKRFDKLLDYDSSTLKLEKNKDMSKAKIMSEEQSLMKNNYEALNAQLVEDLPKFFSLALSIFRECVTNFFIARKRFIGRLTKQILPLMELPAFEPKIGGDDILEDFENEYYENISKFATHTFLPKNFFLQRNDSLRDSQREKKIKKESAATNVKQSDSEVNKLKTQYPPPSIFCAVREYQALDNFEVTLSIGDIVGVIKQQDPMGGTNRWFIDNGQIKGFVPSDCLVPTTSDTTKSKSPRQSTTVPPPTYTEKTHNYPTTTAVIQPTPTPVPVTHDDPPQYYDVVPEDSTSDERYDFPFEETTDTEKEIYYAAYDLNVTDSGTLNLSRGEFIFVLQKHDMEGNPEWWFIEDLNGKKGYVPANYLIKS